MVMSETSLTTASTRDYKISPDHFRKIQEHLEANPDRFNDVREFVFRAIDIFLAWETDPLTGKKKDERDASNNSTACNDEGISKT